MLQRKQLPFFFALAIMLVPCAAGLETDLREVTIDSADARVIELTYDEKLSYETIGSKARPGLVEHQFGLSRQGVLDIIQETSDKAREPLTDTAKLRWLDHFRWNWLNELYAQCERDPGYKASKTQNLNAMQAFVAFVSIAYAVIATWLGSMKLTRWQRRSVLVTYTAAGIIEAVCLVHAFDFMVIYVAYPLTLALTVIFFVAFNVTNALLVLESDEPESAAAVQTQQIIEATSTRVVTAQVAPSC